MTTTKREIVKTLVECGATHAFTLPGLGITWMLDDFYEQRDKLKLVLSRSEQHASIMAQAYGKVTGKPAVLMGMGPFLTTTGAFGILEAYFAGTPLVVLTDTSCYDGFSMRGVYQTMTGDYGAADANAVLRTMTKFCAYATEIDEAIYGVQMAFKHATLPRHGPAAVVLKTSIIKREFELNPRVTLYPSSGHLQYTPSRPDQKTISELAGLIKKANKPLLIVGQGAQNDYARPLVAKVAKQAGLAVATSYNGKGVIDETLPVSVGMLGTWGCKAANHALRDADLVLVLGASLGPDYMRFCESGFLKPDIQTIIQIDIDPRNSGWVYPVKMSITGDVGDALDMLDKHDLGEEHQQSRLKWIFDNNQKHQYGVMPDYKTTDGSVHNADIIKSLDRHLTKDHLLTLDAGNNRIWVTGNLRTRTPGQLLAPGGIGGMGWAIPAAVGAKIAKPQKKVIALTGDGGAGMSVAAMSTAISENSPITVIVANNQGLGMVRDNMKGAHYGVNYPPTNFATIANGLGCKSLEVKRPADLDECLKEAENMDGPCLIDIAIDPAVSHHPSSDY
jgi:acetolactate synthase-1/2/3 large subunit